MSTLGRWWRWLEPGLLCIEPMFAIGYVECVDCHEPPSPQPDVSTDIRHPGRRAVRHERTRHLLVDRS